ncbi:MAG: hypothetical protein ACOYI4_09925 [Christensenellales bacterium]|jgi:uncharacterized protein YegL
MTKSNAKKILKQFQCDYNREIEESFAQTFSENEKIRLFFINENEAFTDGRNIVVDPAGDDLYFDTKALTATESYLGWPKALSVDPWYALRMVTRAQTVHECLHILYTDFPGGVVADRRCDTKNKQKTMAMISNIIEDAYIEAVGCTVYDNLEMYLKFGRISRLFATHPSQGTVFRAFEVKVQDEDRPDSPVPALVLLLDYMADLLLYPMVVQKAPDPFIVEYVGKTRQLFIDGSVAPSPAERYEYSQKIFDSILPLIPDDEVELSFGNIARYVGGTKTHSVVADTIETAQSKGRSQTVSIRLFVDMDGNPRESDYQAGQLLETLEEFKRHKQIALTIVTYEGFKSSFQGKDYDCSALHKDIKINENHPKINLNLRKTYQNIYNRYRININSYNGRFVHLLKARIPVREDKQLFGVGITSKMLGDTKKRYWYRTTLSVDIPDLAVLLLIDGSGSMQGGRRDAAISSSVILHEVLKKQGITHAVVEHRAQFDDPEIDINVLVDFHAREEEKLNLMQINAYGDNRDGLALFWAERYMNERVYCENRLIIVLSDGAPAHEADDYYPPVSTKDTANAAAKIIKRGINIIAVSLDDGDSFDCYDMLKEIYPNIVACNDLKKLTGQLLMLVSKQLQH